MSRLLWTENADNLFFFDFCFCFLISSYAFIFLSFSSFIICSLFSFSNWSNFSLILLSSNSLFLYISTDVISNISGLIKSLSLNFLSNLDNIDNGILGLCSINLSNSTLHVDKNVVPFVVLSLTGNDNSTAMFLDNLPNAKLATLWLSNNSLTLKNCETVVINPAIKFKDPIREGAYGLIESGNDDWAKLAVPVIVLKIITGNAKYRFFSEYRV